MAKNEIEVWKVHPEYTEIEVSTFGRIRTLDRVVSDGRGTYPISGRVLKQSNDKGGYLQLHIPINGKRPTKKVHRLVAQTFIKNPDNLPQVNHKDNDRTNNNVSNLEWCTASYNQKYREKYGVSQTEAAGHPLFAINLKTLEVLHFCSQSEAGRAIGVDKGSINSVIKGKLNKTHGFWFVNDDADAADAIKRKISALQVNILGL